MMEAASTRLHGATTQKTAIFILAAVSTWNLIEYKEDTWPDTFVWIPLECCVTISRCCLALHRNGATVLSPRKRSVAELFQVTVLKHRQVDWPKVRSAAVQYDVIHVRFVFYTYSVYSTYSFDKICELATCVFRNTREQLQLPTVPPNSTHISSSSSSSFFCHTTFFFVMFVWF
jgi:hypothetical protein